MEKQEDCGWVVYQMSTKEFTWFNMSANQICLITQIQYKVGRIRPLNSIKADSICVFYEKLTWLIKRGWILRHNAVFVVGQNVVECWGKLMQQWGQQLNLVCWTQDSLCDDICGLCTSLRFPPKTLISLDLVASNISITIVACKNLKTKFKHVWYVY